MGIIPVETKEEYKEIIRRVMTLNPSMSAMSMQKHLASASSPIKLDRVYVGDLMKEIRAERLSSLDDESKEELYAQFKDVVEYINNQLRAIAQEEKLVYMKTKDGVPTESAEVRIFAQNNRIKALNSVVANLEKLAKLKMDLGLVERKLGSLDVNERVIDVVQLIEKMRNGNYSTPITDLLPALGAGAKR